MVFSETPMADKRARFRLRITVPLVDSLDSLSGKIRGVERTVPLDNGT